MAKAEPTVSDLEAELIAAKDAGDVDTPEYRDLKLRLRATRQAEREARSGVPDGVAAPDTIETTTNGDL